MAPSGPSSLEEASYNFQEVVVAGSFAKLAPDVIDTRLRVRRLRRAGTPTRLTRAFFAGAGAKPELLRKAQERGVPTFGEAELERLLATPFYRFRERFEAVVRGALDYTLQAWWVGAPATEAELAAAEAALGAPLDPALRAFYSQCNGVQFRADLGKAKASGRGPAKLPEPQALPWDVVGSPYGGKLGRGTGGVVAILALDELVKSRGYGRSPDSAGDGERVTVGRRAVPMRTFLENMYLLDGWYDYYPVALFCDRQRQSFEVVVGDDHGAVWNDPDAESFESYLESALASLFLERRHGKRTFRRAV
ncbi:MAG TPA: SMI1/KNR4 family protein [Polyangiaceae bacterium]|nr:SMI1/KNR4 family protein [Polyangiaceae bacterium]